MAKTDTGKKYMKQLDKYKKTSRQNIPVKKKGGFEKKHVLWGIFITLVSFALSMLVLFASTGLLGTASLRCLYCSAGDHHNRCCV